jgi:poly(A) polymerase
MTEREFATDVVRRLRAAGHAALFAGGCVRDMLLGREPDDFDVATDATPEQVRQLFKRTVAFGASFGVVEVLGPKPLKVQVATFRSDVSYSDGRRPDAVVFSSPEEDAKRRDFTINGMFFDPLEDKVIDYVGGQADLDAGILRAIGDARQRFAEDKLRMLRAVRFATRFGFKLDATTADAIRSMAGEITVVSAERIADELRKLLTDPRRADGMRLLADVGLFGVLFPEVADVSKAVRVLEALPADASSGLAFGTILQDLDSRDAGGICQRLKLSNAERDRIEWLVWHHNYLCGAFSLRGWQLKPVLAHDGIQELLALHRGNAIASSDSLEHIQFCEEKLRKWPPEVLNPPPLLTGDDLLAMGVKQGPAYKDLLHSVRVAQLDALIHTKDEAIQLVRETIARLDDWRRRRSPPEKPT